MFVVLGGTSPKSNLTKCSRTAKPLSVSWMSSPNSLIYVLPSSFNKTISS
jgi:hypothetical protein